MEYTILLCISLIFCSFLVAGQIVFPDKDDEHAIFRALNLQPETRNTFNSNPFGPCRISPGRFGKCLPYSECSELRRMVGRNGLSSSMINLLRSRLCAVSSTSFRLCCVSESEPFTLHKGPSVTQAPNIPTVTTRPRNPAGNRNLIPTEDECGFATTNRIIQGETYTHGSHPWLVGLGTLSLNGNFQLQCGGALITRRHVLSASHCFVSQRGSVPITHVILGEHSLSQPTEREAPIIIKIARNSNPGYNTRSHVNDLELLEMERDVDFTGYIRPVCLPYGFENQEFIGESMTIIGWGDTVFRSMQGSDIPLKAKVSIIPRQECNKSYDRSSAINIGREQICASSVQRDACQGDSGGPFLYEGRRTYLAGIVSFGVDCAGGVFPGVYTFIPYYLKWIENNL